VARKGFGRVRTVYRTAKSKARRPRKNDLKKYGTKALKGAGLGMLIAVPLTYAGKKYNQPMLIEAGQRLGSIASTVGGGTVGNASYQAVDAIF